MDRDWRQLPLTPLRTFECVARHASFTRAADELCLTQSAVSQQIRHLESLLGQSLFERQGRRLRLTDAGHRYFAAVSMPSALCSGRRRLFFPSRGAACCGCKSIRR